jgi:CRP-like cAMP-binding protein
MACPSHATHRGLGTLLPRDVADPILSGAAARFFQRGQTIACQGDQPATIFVAVDGWIKLSRFTETGAEAVISCVSSGESFGEDALIGSGRLPVTAEAMTDCSVKMIRAEILREIMFERRDVMASVFSLLEQRTESMVVQIEQLKTRSAAQRLADFLTDLCPVSRGPCTIMLPYEKVVIAGRLGMQPESLSRAFGKLAQIGVKVTRSRVLVRDAGALAGYAGQDRAEAWRRLG